MRRITLSDYQTIRLWLLDCKIFLLSNYQNISNIVLANSRNYRTIGNRIKASIYRTIGYRTQKKLSVAHLCMEYWPTQADHSRCAGDNLYLMKMQFHSGPLLDGEADRDKMVTQRPEAREKQIRRTKESAASSTSASRRPQGRIRRRAQRASGGGFRAVTSLQQWEERVWSSWRVERFHRLLQHQPHQVYYIQHCFICRPSDSTVPTDAGIEPRTVEAGALAVRRSSR
jgi:hypothetical protein